MGVFHIRSVSCNVRRGLCHRRKSKSVSAISKEALHLHKAMTS